jgi:hypothetical protein
MLNDGSEVSDHEKKDEVIYNTYKERLGTSSDPPMLFDLTILIQPVPGLEQLFVFFTKE